MNIANTRLSINYYRESRMGLNIFDIINSNTVKVLKPRTFDLNTSPSSNPKNNSNQPTKEIVTFDDMIKCDKCKKNIEIGILTIAFNEMNKDKLLKCPECHNLFSPKIPTQLFFPTFAAIFWFTPIISYFLFSSIFKGHSLNEYLDVL